LFSLNFEAGQSHFIMKGPEEERGHRTARLRQASTAGAWQAWRAAPILCDFRSRGSPRQHVLATYRTGLPTSPAFEAAMASAKDRQTHAWPVHRLAAACALCLRTRVASTPPCKRLFNFGLRSGNASAQNRVLRFVQLICYCRDTMACLV
jgi:hypothetical protein